MSKYNLIQELSDCVIVEDLGDKSNRILCSPSGFRVEFKFDKGEAFYKLSTPDNQSFLIEVSRSPSSSWKVYLDGQDYQLFVDEYSDEFLRQMIMKHFDSGEWISGKPILEFCAD